MPLLTLTLTLVKCRAKASMLLMAAMSNVAVPFFAANEVTFTLTLSRSADKHDDLSSIIFFPDTHKKDFIFHS